MLRTFPSLALLVLAFWHAVAALPTWPAPTDDLEDILFLNTGYRARGYSQAVTPCSAGVAPGRVTAAEWIRTAFHDMATGNTFTGVGGLDASIQFELTSGENQGSGFSTSLTLFEPFFSSRTSLSDVIAAGVYTATRSCGGPIVPVRGGRIDATEAGPIGVPLPQNALGIFRNQFLRFGYNATEMIAFTACGHSLGGVHSENFPDIVPPGSAPNNIAHMDSTPSNFDNRIAVEFADGSTRDPLVMSNTKKNSDLVVFSSDTNNATIKSLTDAVVFQSTCKTMFQRMVETVPAGVTLSEIIEPYEVKPYGLQLTLLDGGLNIRFTGEIRIRTTKRPASSITGVQLLYKDRTGASAPLVINSTYRGDAQGFDDTFSFFGFDEVFSAEKSISSFSVVVTSSGGTEVFDNNNAGFRIDDSVIFQAPQSCMSGSDLTVFAAVRAGAPVPNLTVVVKIPRPSPSIIPSLSTASVPMAIQSSVGVFGLYSASYTFSGSQAQSAVFGVSLPKAADNDKSPTNLPTACTPLSTAPPTSVPRSSAFSFQGCYTDAGPTRALPILSNATDTMTVETCAASCSQYPVFGLEYGRECYCGTTLSVSSTPTALADCNMPCAGNANQRCGAGYRLSVYNNLLYTAPPTPEFPGYTYEGCLVDSVAQRLLSSRSMQSDVLTYASCADFCAEYQYFGVEFGVECYCGNALPLAVDRKDDGECNVPCTGNSTAMCGAAFRINIFRAPNPNNGTAPANPQVPGYNYSGCYTDSVNSRTLSTKFLFDEGMTVGKCASFCGGARFFGVEYGGECYCGEEMGNGGTKAQESECGVLCKGDRGQYCGGANRLSVWERLVSGNGTSAAA